MWKINNEKLELFRKYSKGYLYQLDKGAYLCFTKEGVYEGVTLMFLGNVTFYEQKADQYLMTLERRGLVEFVD